ncbi:MAG: hypothetical protein ACTHKS_18375 [Gaiellaceae bacterium]
MRIDFTEFEPGEEHGAAFAALIKLNPEGYVLHTNSPAGPFGMLHLGGCPHWDGTDPRYAAGVARKVCTTTRFMMNGWIAENLEGEPVNCPDCF